MSLLAILSLVFGLILMVFAALCAAQDTALNNVSPARVVEIAHEDELGSRKMLYVVEHRDTYSALIVFLRTTFELVATILFATLFLETVGTMEGRGTGTAWALVYAGIVSVLCSYVVAGVSARTLGLQKPYTVLRYTAALLIAFGWVFRPISRLLVRVGNAVTPGKGFKEGPFSTDIELKEFVTLAQQRGAVEDDEREMIESVVQLGTNNARSAMVPRTDMVWIESTKTANQAIKLAVKSGFSRIPVIADTVDDVVGTVYLKDLVAYTYSEVEDADSVTVGELMRPAWFIPDSKSLDDVLDEMRAKRNHIAVLIDEYGGVAGLITIEDILEEIVGEISDEYDASEVAPLEELGDNRWRASARLSIDDLAEAVGVEFREELLDEVDTVGGLLAYELGRVPLPGAHIHTDTLDLVAEAGHDHRGRRRVTTVLVKKILPVSEETPADEDEGKDD